MTRAPWGAVARHRTGPLGHHAVRGAAVACAVIGILALAYAGFSVIRSGRLPDQPIFMPGVNATSGPDPGAPSGFPTAIKIPAISVQATLEQLRLAPDGTLTPPKFTDAGWYAQGTAPGDIGPAVIAAHVDTKSGPAVFFRLRDLQSGDKVLVLRGGRWLTFVVTAVGRYPKSHFPTAKVYGPTPVPELRLITCGGTFNRQRSSYDDNVVVYAQESA